MMDISTRAASRDLPAGVEIKRAAAADISTVTPSGIFEGYASLFGIVDSGRDESMLMMDESGSGTELLDIQCALAALDFELKLCKLIRFLKYSPSQPRVPAGSPEGGQWARGGGGVATGQASEADSGSEATIGSVDAAPLEEGRSATEGERGLPDVPNERPPTAQERNAIIKEVAKVPPSELRRVFESAPWLYAHEAEIRA